MNVNSTSSLYTSVLPVRTATSKTQDSGAMPDKPSNAVEKKDTVSLSYSAIAAAQEEKENQAAKVPERSSAIGSDLPIEAYAIPDWMKGYYNDITYMMTMGLPANYVPPENAAYEAGSQQDKIAYGELLQSHIKIANESSGLGNAAQRYHAIKNDPSLEEKLHQAFMASVSADSEMMALMRRLGISLS